MRLEVFIATAFLALAAGSVTSAQQVPGQPAVPRGAAPGGAIPEVGANPVPAAVVNAQPEKEDLEFNSRLLHPGLMLAESEKGVFGVRLTAEVAKNRFGRGKLILERNAPAYDEFGFRTAGGTLPPVELECTLNMVKKRQFQWGYTRHGQDLTVEEEWLLFKIQGPKITSRLFLAMLVTKDPFLKSGRLLVQDKDGKVQYAVDVKGPPPVEPCHPGCFPAGTIIHVPGGTKPIDRIRVGDVVTTVGPDGVASSGKVTSVFATRNRLVEVRTEAGNLLTTATQPFSLAGGGLRAAGELKAGDRIDRWNGRERGATMVRSVSATGREEDVFNLVVGDQAIFIANGYLVRSKPPAPAAAGRTDRVVP